jgi:predicted DNA-binding transcriptional regulator AlpA
MAQAKWLTAAQVGARYGVCNKWVYAVQRRDPSFPRGVRFTNGTTRWSVEALDAYDAEKQADQT